jgi:uncharacterized protein (TIGR03086 family)
MTDYRELYRRALDRFGEHVHSIRADQWGEATPCTEWDVRALVQHLVYETMWMPPLLNGKTIADVGDALSGDLLGDDPIGAWDRSAKENAEAVDSTLPDSVVHISRGDITAEQYTNEVFTDLVIHGWDLARAIGADETLDAESVDLLYGIFKPMEAGLKASGAYGPQVVPPSGASRQTELLAIFGRVA